jgi:hypothetical protein
MADVIIKKWNGTGWEEHYPKTTVGNIVATGTPSSTTFLRGDGTWSFVPIVTKADLTYTYVYGKAQSAITKGQAVQFAGVQGDHILMKPAVPSEINANPDYFIGLAETTLASEDFGYVLTHGELSGINTSSYTEGDILWFASAGSTAGALTQTEPTGLNARIQVAAVNRTNAGNGIIFVRVDNVGVQVQDIVAGGTASSTTFLRGDGTWSTVAGGGGDFLPLTGGTLTGSLGVGGDPETSLGYVYLTVGKNETNKLGILKFRSTYNSGNGSEIYQDTNGKTYLNVNGSLNAIVYETSGNVGIGNTSPDHRLVVGGLADTRVQVDSSSTQGIYFTKSGTNNGTFRTSADGDFEFFTKSVNQALVLKAGGALGIGTTDPSRKLDVNGSSRFRDTMFFGGSDSEGLISWNANGFVILGESGKGMAFGANGVNNHMYINTSGDVGIGTLSPGAKLDVQGDLLINNPSVYGRINGHDTYHSIVLRGNISGTSSQSVVPNDSMTFAEYGGIFRFKQLTPSANTDLITLTPSGLYIGGSNNNGRIYADDWGIKVGTDSGHVWIGPANTGHAHIYTDRPNFYFNKDLLVNGSTVFHTGNISISSGVSANHVVQRDANGYIYANHINFNTSESENPSINSFITGNGDGWSRKSSLQHVKNSIRGVADGTWGINWDSSGRNYSREWIEMPNYTGLYSPNNNAHFYPNNLSYGAWKITGSRNTYNGIEFVASTGNISLMVQNGSNTTGFHNNSYGWQFYWESGSLKVAKNTYGGGTIATVIDSTTIGSQSVNYASSAGSASSASTASSISAGGSTWIALYGSARWNFNSNDFTPSGSMSHNLGTSSYYWLRVSTCQIARNSEFALSDVYMKKDIKKIIIEGNPLYQPTSFPDVKITEQEKEFFEAVKTLFEKINIYTFDYKGREGSDPTNIGFMAQEIEEILKDYPMLVNLLIENSEEQIKDEEGNVKEIKKFKHLRVDNLDSLMAIMIKHIYFKVKDLEKAVTKANEMINKIKNVLINKSVANEEEL